MSPGAERRSLPRGISEPALREAVAASRSWRGVLRHLDSTSAHLGRQLRRTCDELGIDYSHFSVTRFDDATLVDVVASAQTWDDVLEGLGYARNSGTARATIRKHCQRLGLDVAKLESPRMNAQPGASAALVPRPEHLRVAGPYLVTSALILMGCPTSMAPEGAPYDLVVDHPLLGLQRVQVKTTTHHGSAGAASWVCGLTRSEYLPGVTGGHGRAHYRPNEVDAFACVAGDGAIYLIPIQDVAGRTSISLRKYSGYQLPIRFVGLTVSEFRTSLTGVSGHR